MSPDRTASTTLRAAIAPRRAAPETAPPDGFAALLGAVDRAAPGRAERRDAGESGGPGDRAESGRGRGDRAESGRAEPRDAGESGRGPGDRAETGRGPSDRAETGRGAGDHAETGRGPGDRARGSGPHRGGHDAGAPTAEPLAAPLTTAPLTHVVPATEPALVDPLLALAAPIPAADTATAGAPAPALPAGPVAPATPVLATPPAATPGIPAPLAATPAAAVAPLPAAPTIAGGEAAAPVADLPHDALSAAPALPHDETPETAPETMPTALRDPAAQSAATPGPGTGTEQGAPREQPAPASAEAPAPAPSAPPAPPAQAAPAPVAGLAAAAARTTPLHQAPRAVAQVIQVAQDRGISHAKLNLRPVELGGIEIRLQSSSAGVTAQVVADSPEAAKLLQQAADDLRRSLERQDVTLLSLDVSTAGDGRPDGSAGTSADLAGDRARHFAAFGGTPENADADAAPAVVQTVEIADGVHIDVLA